MEDALCFGQLLLEVGQEAFAGAEVSTGQAGVRVGTRTSLDRQMAVAIRQCLCEDRPLEQERIIRDGVSPTLDDRASDVYLLGSIVLERSLERAVKDVRIGVGHFRALVPEEALHEMLWHSIVDQARAHCVSKLMCLEPHPPTIWPDDAAFSR